MKKLFVTFLLIFFSFLNQNLLSKDNAEIQKIFEGLNLPAHISKNDFISPNSIFILEHKLGHIKEINDYNKSPTINPNPILNIQPLLTESESWEQGFNGFAFSPNFKKDKYIFVSYNNKKNQIVLSRFKYDETIKQAKIS